jgi:ribosomal protein L19E
MLEDKMLETNEVKEPTENINEHLSREELIERYAQIQKISIEQAQEEVDAPTEEEILKKIQDKTIEKINSTRVSMNRAQRRALKKKVGAKKYAEMVSESGDVVEAVSETAKKLNYIDLIQKLRKLNKEKQENGEAIDEDD